MMDVLHTSNNNSVLTHTLRQPIPQQQSTMNHTNQLPSLSSFSLNLTSGTTVSPINVNRASSPISSFHQPSFISASNGLNTIVKRENERLPLQSSTPPPPLSFASSRPHTLNSGHILAKPSTNNVSLPPLRSIFQEIPEYTDSTNRYFTTTGNQYNQYNSDTNNARQISRNSSHSSVAGTIISNSPTFGNASSVSLQQANSLPSPQSISTSPPPPVFPHNIKKSDPLSTSSSSSSLPPLNQVLMYNYDSGSSTSVDNGINHTSSISSAAHALESLHRGINRPSLRDNNMRSNNEQQNTDSSYSSSHNHNENNSHGKTVNLVRKYKCKTCLKSFTTSGHLARHTRIHTGERKHACPFEGCGARFSRQDNCMQHYKTHLNQSRRKSKLKKNSNSTSSTETSNGSKEQLNSVVTSGSDDDNELVHKSPVKK